MAAIAAIFAHAIIDFYGQEPGLTCRLQLPPSRQECSSKRAQIEWLRNGNLLRLWLRLWLWLWLLALKYRWLRRWMAPGERRIINHNDKITIFSMLKIGQSVSRLSPRRWWWFFSRFGALVPMCLGAWVLWPKSSAPANMIVQFLELNSFHHSDSPNDESATLEQVKRSGLEWWLFAGSSSRV